MNKRFALGLFLFLLLVALAGLPLAAQEPYKLPPKNVMDILDAPPTPRAEVRRRLAFRASRRQHRPTRAAALGLEVGRDFRGGSPWASFLGSCWA